MTASDVWRFVGQQARLSFGQLAATVDISYPGRGLHAVSLRGNPLARTSLLAPCFLGQGNDPEQSVADRFIRGRDLVVTYAQNPAHPVRLQIYWRADAAADAPGCLAAVDVQISVQTSLLHAWPALAIRTCLPGGEPWRLAIGGDGKPSLVPAPPVAARAPAGCWVWRLPGCELTYAEIAHPADVDFEQWRQADSESIEISHQMFMEPLEKGVILRARARGVFVAADGDLAAIAAAQARFLAAPLPLTT